jgi:hypothetical protein
MTIAARGKLGVEVRPKRSPRIRSCANSGTVAAFVAQQITLRRGQHFSFSGTNCSMAAALPYTIGAQTPSRTGRCRPSPAMARGHTQRRPASGDRRERLGTESAITSALSVVVAFRVRNVRGPGTRRDWTRCALFQAHYQTRDVPACGGLADAARRYPDEPPVIGRDSRRVYLAWPMCRVGFWPRARMAST